jgi:hypothetical protein
LYAPAPTPQVNSSFFLPFSAVIYLTRFARLTRDSHPFKSVHHTRLAIVRPAPFGKLRASPERRENGAIHRTLLCPWCPLW